ncbi:septal ring lytic transglycosylase RlpA family protein [Phyllobacterium sp. 628]|uniref:septal ring lytic transglycosylase RlpA family protein n=1 Tax=Phyllobacterium sp. 628 TaxID=2718938 RepID=UPI00166275E5|nr:septal ring lytic transglycosylase RlpA family protein [Phyllobacterium sp. 628]QND52898.1 septal ring lytic transglycosylase RlpA family protein [Phyllobacterium sp. 628]
MGALMAACASSPKVKVGKRSHGKEYFAESEYGVKASPRVVTDFRNMPRGGGRDQLGRPYQVRGKWYYPKEEPGYKRQGLASWYGSAFHGRLTANGEVYDMNHLSAAHPTMPLPSYARVTNLANGSSVIVRVNDRGPYHSNRVIDLSQKAATMLDYQHTGTADVKVEYVGRAPLEGRDDAFLLASYRGPGAPDPWGQPASGVMIAMNGSTPTQRNTVAIPGMRQPRVAGVQVASLDVQPVSFNDQAANLGAPMPRQSQQQMQQAPAEMQGSAAPFNYGADPVLPMVGPYIDDKPAMLLGSYKGTTKRVTPFASSYADERIASANATADAMNSLISPVSLSDAWKVQNKLDNVTAPAGEYVDVGLFKDKSTAARVMAALTPLGKVDLSEVNSPEGMRVALIARAKTTKTTDALLQAAWKAGAGDAFVVRDDGN